MTCDNCRKNKDGECKETNCKCECHEMDKRNYEDAMQAEYEGSLEYQLKMRGR